MQRDQIEARAYEKWVQKGRPPDTQLYDWLEAEAELRRAEGAMGEGKERFQWLIENAPSVILCLSPDHRVLEWNHAAERVHGLPRGEAVGKDYLELCLPEGVRDIVACHLRGVLAGEPVAHFENPVRTREGGERVLGWTAARLVRAPGGPPEVLVIGRDITERKRAEEARYQQELRLRLLLEQMPAVVWSTDTDLRFTSSLGAGLAALGLKPNEVVGRSLFDFFHTDDPNFPPIAAQRGAVEGKSLGYELTWGERTFQIHVEPLHSLEGAITGSIGVALDITERKRAEEALRQAHQQLERRVAERTAELSQANAVLNEQVRQREQAETVLRSRAEEFEVARRIQQGLLPRAAPALPGFEIAGASFPTHETGGDYFDFLPLPGDCLGVAVGDASGHGLGAAMLVAEARAYLRAAALTQADVGQMLSFTNRRLAEDITDDYFVTLLLARLDPHTRSLEHTSAGHPLGYVLDPRGEVRATLGTTGLPLGIDPAGDYPAPPALTLEPGDLVLLLTDGLLEARAPEGAAFGEQVLEAVRANRSRPAREIVVVLHEAVRAFCRGLPIPDDVTAVVIKVQSG